jgi:hypothetical protein
MTYRPGISPAVARMLGEQARGPGVICDGCGIVRRIHADRPPPAWFLDGKAAPGWRMTRDGDKRDDRCPRCKP